MNDFPRPLKIATVWLLVGLLLFLGVRAFEARQQDTRFQSSGAVVEIQRARDGHYHWPGEINGHAVDFLIDTGATRSAMSSALARQLELEPLGAVESMTAGGVVSGTLVRADIALRGGVRINRLRITALPGLSDQPLLGMDVLGKLRFEQQGSVLTFHLGDTP